jgi:hypothetical protein
VLEGESEDQRQAVEQVPRIQVFGQLAAQDPRRDSDQERQLATGEQKQRRFGRIHRGRELMQKGRSWSRDHLWKAGSW